MPFLNIPDRGVVALWTRRAVAAAAIREEECKTGHFLAIVRACACMCVRVCLCMREREVREGERKTS